MRNDQFAFQQATRVAALGVLLQAAVGLTLLVFGLNAGDTTFVFASYYVFTGIAVWGSLVVVFHQHRLERLESLEADELAAQREASGSVFERSNSEFNVAARRLQLMYVWFLPVVSCGVAALLAGLGWWIMNWFGRLGDATENVGPFLVTESLGWALALALALALLSFIFSRFVAGMAQQPVWQNLRGGAGFMVGNALVLLAVAAGMGFQFAKKTSVIESVAYGISIFMLALAAEIVLNFILNLYRPRRPGEYPRPAFDSRLLSLLAAPDSLVRSINEAVNYQFGFDITSSWGYQLLLRSTSWLVGFGLATMVLMSMMVVVDADQRAIRLRFGQLVGGVQEPGLLFKLPWPIETAEIYTVGRLHTLSLSVNPAARTTPNAARVNFWAAEDPNQGDRRLFLAGASRLGAAGSISPDATPESADQRVGERFSLVDADIDLHYRVRPAELMQHLEFASGATTRRAPQPLRERIMRVVALQEVSDYLSTLPLEDVLSPGRSGILEDLRERIQQTFDAPEHRFGVDVVSLTVPLLRPPQGESTAASFEEFSISVQARQQTVNAALQNAQVTMAALVSNDEVATSIVAAIAQAESAAQAGNQAEAERLRAEAAQLIVAQRARAAVVIESAEAQRWRTQMEAAGEASRLLGDLPMFEAAPELYRQRQIMAVLAQTLPRVRVKYILATQPQRMNFDVKMQEAEAGLNFLDAIEKPESNDNEPRVKTSG
ncbi:MAG: hypothetical protein KDA22_15735 [Phycisphaerales bacterium]|nr:hypothetical protein [Phycisphaerales bacterium]